MLKNRGGDNVVLSCAIDVGGSGEEEEEEDEEEEGGGGGGRRRRRRIVWTVDLFCCVLGFFRRHRRGRVLFVGARVAWGDLQRCLDLGLCFVLCACFGRGCRLSFVSCNSETVPRFRGPACRGPPTHPPHPCPAIPSPCTQLRSGVA